MSEPNTDTSWMAPGARCTAQDAAGKWHTGVITYGPARDRDGVRGKFIKVWVDFDHSDGHDEIPWPVEDVRREDAQ